MQLSKNLRTPSVASQVALHRLLEFPHLPGSNSRGLLASKGYAAQEDVDELSVEPRTSEPERSAQEFVAE